MSNKYLGVIGGGQLGMFTCIAAKKKGLNTLVFSNSKDFSAKNFCDDFIIGDFHNLEFVDKFLKKADFFTIETENIPLVTLKNIEKKKNIYPKSNVVKICQNRLLEKEFINSINGVKTTEYFELKNFEELSSIAEKLNFNCILKSKEFGYDGKGQFSINKNNITEFQRINFEHFIIEKFVKFKKEISVIVIRSNFETINYPPVENIHKNAILRESLYPANISDEIKKKAEKIAKQIAQKIKLIGVLAIEMFVLENNEILINELAPRPHNSGHWSMDACNESQYDNLVNVVCNKSLNEPKILKNCKMINLIGSEYNKINELKTKYKCYDYFKKEIRNLRKMGHYVILE